MARGDAGHSSDRAPTQQVRRRGGALRKTSTLVVVLVLLLAGASYRFDLGPRWLGWDYPSPRDEPAEVLPPPGLGLPAAGSAPVVAEDSPEIGADPAKVRQAVSALVAEKKLGPRVAVVVNQLSDGSPVYRSGVDLVVPASTMKLVTTTAVLAALGPDHRFATTVRTGANPKQIVLVGGGDPLLERAPGSSEETYPPRADIRTLAVGTARALRATGRTSVQLRYDTSLFEGPAASPAWKPSYIADNVVSPISPLWVDEGLETPGLVFRVDDPAAVAATLFADELRRQDISVRGAPAPAVAPEDSTELAAVESAPLGQIVQWVLEESDNEAAEVLFRQVAVAEGRPGSFDGGSAAVTDVLGRLGVDLSGQRVLDGSGLSRQNRLRPDTLLRLLGLAASDEHPELRSVAVDLPVAGFTGSLADRFETGDDDGLGRVRAKTGTLSGVHGLAGLVTDLDGTVLSFVAIADRVRIPNTLDARALLDEISAALAGCSCAVAEQPEPSAEPEPSPSPTA